MENLAVVVCLHGDETFGLKIKEKLLNVPVFVGNPEAVKKDVRYIDSDLNRCFPGRADGDYEEKRANELLKELTKFEYILDIHSSSCDLDLFGIITKPNIKKINFAKKIGLKRAIIMSEKIASGKSLIDNVPCGISLEIGPHKKKENVDQVLSSINNLLNDKILSDNRLELFEVFDIIPREDNLKYLIENFRPVKKGDLIAEGNKKCYAPFDFIPVFVGEKAYKNIACFAMKKILDPFTENI
mgnify:CR=1 FL=1